MLIAQLEAHCRGFFNPHMGRASSFLKKFINERVPQNPMTPKLKTIIVMSVHF